MYIYIYIYIYIDRERERESECERERERGYTHIVHLYDNCLSYIHVRWKVYINFIIQHMKTCVIHSPHQPPSRGDARVSVAKLVLPPLAPSAAFVTGQCIYIY